MSVFNKYNKNNLKMVRLLLLGYTWNFVVLFCIIYVFLFVNVNQNCQEKATTTWEQDLCIYYTKLVDGKKHKIMVIVIHKLGKVLKLIREKNELFFNNAINWKQ